MVTLLSALGVLIVNGVVSGAAWDLTKAAWARSQQRPWETLYLDAFAQAVDEMRPELEGFADGGEVRVDRQALQRLLHQDLVLNIVDLTPSDLARDGVVSAVAAAMQKADIVVVGGHTLSDDSYAQLVRNLVKRAHAALREAVVHDTPAFRRALLAESQGNRTALAETQALFEQKFDVAIDLLSSIDQGNREIIKGNQEIVNRLNTIDQNQKRGAVGDYFQEQLGLRLTSSAEKRLEDLKEAWLEGKRAQVERDLASLKNDDFHWGVLERGAKANYLRFEARTCPRGERRKAGELAEEARVLAPDAAKDARLQAWLAYLEGDYASALKELAGQDDLESVNLRALLLLETGELAEAERVLRLEGLGLKPDAETHRICALVNATKKDLARARREADHARALKPRRVNTRFTSAAVDYLSGVSPAAVDVSASPPLVNPFFLKQDEDSRSHVRRAAKVFKELAEEMQDQPGERQAHEAWHLVCLAHDPTRLEEAVAYCRSLLAANPRHDQAIRWACANRLENTLPLEASREALSSSVEEGEANVGEIAALVGCHLAAADARAAAHLLEQSKSTFESARATEWWTFWRLRLMAMTGQTGPALMEINRSEPTLDMRHVRMDVLRELAKNLGDWQPLGAFLDNSYKETEHPFFLVESCKLRAWLEDWAYVADHAQALVNGVGTADAVQLAATGTYHAGRYGSCLTLLEGSEKYFPAGKFPERLDELKVNCYAASGRIRDAVAEAERFSGLEPSTAKLFQLLNLYVASLNLDQAVAAAGKLEDKEDLAAPHLLQLANLTKHRDAPLSVRLWKRAESSGLPDALVGQALGLAFQLGLDEEAQRLLSRAADLPEPESAGVYRLSPHETIPVFKERQDVQARLWDAYERGVLPVHAVAEPLNRSLVSYFHTGPTFNERSPNPARQEAIFIRHGGRADVGVVGSGAALCLDVSALLLARHLDILDAVVEVYGPLTFAQEVSYALLHARDKILDHQPRRFAVMRTITELVRQRHVRIVKEQLAEEILDETLQKQLGAGWAALFAEAKRTGGYLVDYLPLHNLDGPIPLVPEGAENHLVNCRALLNALPLAQAERDSLLEQLGSAGRGDGLYTRPERNKPLFLRGNIAEVLARAGALRRVCEHFPVYIEQRTLDRLEAELSYHSARQEQLDWLDDLIGHLQRGIQMGAYLLLPASPEPMRERAAETDDVNLDALASLLHHPPAQDGVYWIDDRYLTSSSVYQGQPIVGINEVLKGLWRVGRLSSDEYYSKLDRLRNGNFRFIPIEVDEVLYHLRQAPVEGGGVVAETPQLATLRRYTAAWLSRAHLLQRPPRLHGDAARNGELIFAVRLNRVVDEALAAVWLSEDEDAVCRAYSAWVLESLNTDILGLRSATALQSDRQDDLGLSAMSVMTLIMNALHMPPNKRQRYFAWLEDRLLLALFDGRSDFVEGVTHSLKNYYLLIVNMDVEATGAARLLIRRFHDDLPKALRKALESDQAFMKRLGTEASPVVAVGDISFDALAFWEAAREAVNGRPAELAMFNGHERVTLRPIGDHRIGFHHPRTEEGIDVGDFAPLLASPDAREQALRQRRVWFDCPRDIAERALRDILDIGDGAARLAAAHAWRDASPTLYYDLLGRRSVSQPSTPLKDLSPPDAKRLLWHYRLPEDFGDDFGGALAAAASQLTEEEGLEAAVKRLACFPVPLPQGVINEVRALAEKDRLDLVLRLARAPRSPLSQLHFLRLVDEFRDEARAYRRLARHTAQSLLGVDGVKTFDAFQALLHWVSSESQVWPEVADWPPATRLALVWTHTHRLFSILTPEGTDLTRFTAFFSYQRRLSAELFVRSPAYWFDVAHPRQVYHINFLLCGLSYALNRTVPPYLAPPLRDLLDPEKNGGMRFTYRDLDRATNSLDSFFTNAFRETLVGTLQAEHRRAASAESFRDPLVNALDKIDVEGEEYLVWLYIQVLLGELPPYPEAVQKLTQTVLLTDFVALTKRRPQDGLLALHAASVQTRHLISEKAKQHVKAHLISVCRHLASEYDERGERNPETALSMLSESVFNICAGETEEEGVLTEVERLLTRMVDGWPALAANLRPVVQRFCEEMPPSQAKHFWPLLIRLRAER